MNTCIALVLAMLAGGCASRRERLDDRRDARTEAMSGWTKLGERWVDRSAAHADHDVLVVTASQGTFTRLSLVVEHSALELYDMTIHFADGTTYSPHLRLKFAKNSGSRVIDLPGGARVVRKVEFYYRNLRGGGRAQVELWGR